MCNVFKISFSVYAPVSHSVLQLLPDIPPLTTSLLILLVYFVTTVLPPNWKTVNRSNYAVESLTSASHFFPTIGLTLSDDF